jgi:hypothetical protein
MKKRLATKIADIKFTLKRLENDYNSPENADTCELLRYAINTLEQAEKNAEYAPDNEG